MSILIVHSLPAHIASKEVFTEILLVHIKYGAGSIMYRGSETKRHGVKMREEKMMVIMMMNILVFQPFVQSTMLRVYDSMDRII